MTLHNPRCLMGLETECLTLAGGSTSVTTALSRLLDEIARRVPALPGPTGIFTSYGRIYVDAGHLELATAECDSPFALVVMSGQLQKLVQQSVAALRELGVSLVFANCNHSGLLRDNAPTWGSHGNYLVDQHPDQLSPLLHPFLVTGIYTGAMGVHSPSGEIVGSVRRHFLERTEGGDTVHHRALHSTARHEHFTRRPERFGYRYHTLLADGVRSQLNLLLRFGTTALVLKALALSPEPLVRVPSLDRHLGRRAFWLRSMAHLNRLQRVDDELRIHPLVCDIQEVYLRAADDYVRQNPDAPQWMKQVLAIWESTLAALRRNDQAWLQVRLDPWIKFRLFREYLAAHKADWEALTRDEGLASGLALLNQNYHEFTNPHSVFDQLDRSGLLRHRVGADVEPGSEPDPYIPQVATRAARRARFIRDHAGDWSCRADWDGVEDLTRRAHWRLDDPWDSETALGE